MLTNRIPPEAELQPDLDVGAPLGVELTSTLEVIAGEASLAAGWSLGLAADSLRRRGRRADLPSDRSGGHAGGLQIEYLLLLRSTDRTADRLADAADRRGLAPLLGRRCARPARFRSHLTCDEAPAKEEPRQPLFGLMLPRCTDFSSQHQEGLPPLTGGPAFFVCSDTCPFRRPDPRHR